MSMSSDDQGPRGARREGKDQPSSGPEQRGMHPEDDKLVSKPLSRQDEMMRVAIAGFLGLFLVTMALAQSSSAPEAIPEPHIIPPAAALPPAPPPPVIVELQPPPVAPMRASGDNRLYGRVVTVRGREYEGYLRWDRNEGSWADLLDANKRVPSRDVARRTRTVVRPSVDEEIRLRDQERQVRDEERRDRERSAVLAMRCGAYAMSGCSEIVAIATSRSVVFGCHGETTTSRAVSRRGFVSATSVASKC